MAEIFISYRRNDSPGYTGRLYDRLVNHFGDRNVFWDINSISPGDDFIEVINRRVGSCEALIAVIGRKWLTSSKNRRRQLDDPNDVVRLEIGVALQRRIWVFPVLVDGARMPQSTRLPKDLQDLVRRQGTALDNSNFHQKVDHLIDSIDKALANRRAVSSQPRPRTTHQRVFMCYSAVDAEIVETIAKAYLALGLALEDLRSRARSGANWQEQVKELVDKADIFQLFWSKNAAVSQYVEQEWRYALSKGREHFIRPVYWEEILTPPPPELAHLHFSHIKAGIGFPSLDKPIAPSRSRKRNS
jgi:hypothetical protein